MISWNYEDAMDANCKWEGLTNGEILYGIDLTRRVDNQETFGSRLRSLPQPPVQKWVNPPMEQSG